MFKNQLNLFQIHDGKDVREDMQGAKESAKYLGSISQNFTNVTKLQWDLNFGHKL